MKVYAFLITSLILILGCSSKDSEEEPVPEGPAAVFHGYWEGQYQKLDREKGITLSETLARASFTATDDINGTFILKFPDDTNAKTEGTYQVFKNESLLMKIEDSNVSGIGLKGSVTSVDFEVSGDALVLENDRLKLLLIKNVDGSIDDDGSDPDPDNEEDINIEGTWNCSDSLGVDWNMEVSSRDFNVITKASGGSTSEFSGSVAANSMDNGYVLTVKDSTVADFVERTLDVTRNESTITVVMNSTTGKALDSFICE